MEKKEYRAEPFCKMYQNVFDVVEILPPEQRYPTIKAIFEKRCGHPIETIDFCKVNKELFDLAIGYIGVEVENND